ncbi:hypothetical protein [Arthrobacter sp. IK3]|uniref:hypothetical protein n=1 Tax=Arthrobacter sp. IK3 TaxID=3448169 RepID=UPI003EE0246E
MRPSLRHRFLSVPTGVRVDLQWPAGPGFRRRLHGIIGCSTSARASSPDAVDPQAFARAFTILHEDPHRAAGLFHAMGYEVTVGVHDSAGTVSAQA